MEKRGLKSHFAVALLEHVYLTIALLPILLKRHHRHFWCVRLNQKPHNFPKFHVKGSFTFLFIFMCESKSRSTKRLIWHNGSYISFTALAMSSSLPYKRRCTTPFRAFLSCTQGAGAADQLPSISSYWSELSVHFSRGLHSKSALRPPCCRKFSYSVDSGPCLYTFALD